MKTRFALFFFLLVGPISMYAQYFDPIIDVGDGDNTLTPPPDNTYIEANVVTAGGLQVNTFTGNLLLTRRDLLIRSVGPELNLTFSYNSGETKYDYGFGGGWTNTFNTLYEKLGSDLMIKRWDGNRDTFRFAGGVYTPPIGCYDSLRQYAPGRFRLRTKYGVEYFFDDSTHRKVTSVRDRNGNATTISYSGGRQVLVTNAIGQSIALVWSGGRLTQLVDSISSPGRTISYQYDAQGNPNRVNYPLGKTLRYEYGVRKRITRLIDARTTSFEVTYNDSGAVTRLQSPLSDEQFQYNAGTSTTTYTIDGRSTTYAYDGMRRLIDIAGACCGYHRQFQYDAANNITGLIDANGYTTTYTYDGRGNRLTETDPLTHTAAFTYEPVLNHVTSMTDKRGNTTLYSYDGKGNLTGITRPLGITESFTYNSVGLVVSATDPKGGVSTFTYDGNNRLAGIAHPIGSESFTHDNVGNILSHTDGNGNATTYTYDGLNRRLTMQNALSEVTSYMYDPNDNVTTITGANGNVTNYTYDGLNRKVGVTDGIGTLQTNNYDNAGNLTSSLDGNGNVTTYVYDAQNRLMSTTRGGVTENYTYDVGGRKLTSTDGAGHTTTYIYDQLDRRLSASIGGVTVSTSYDNNGNALTRTDGKGNTVTYAHDAINRLTTGTFPDASTMHYTYDGNNNLVTRTDKNGGVTTYIYDGNNRLTKRDFPGSNDDNYTYDAGGRVLTANNSDASITYTYDAKDQVLSETMNGRTTGYSYNTAARLRTITYPGGTVVQEAWNLRERLASVSQGAVNTTFIYDGGNRLLTAAYGSHLSSSYTYNSRNLVTSLLHSSGSTMVAGYAYAHDNADNRTTAIDIYDSTRSEVYGYSNLDWLTSFMRGKLAGSAIPSPVDSVGYGYDNAASWTYVAGHGTTTYATNNLNQYTNNSAGRWFAYDLKGNMTATNNRGFAYDDRNRLVRGIDSSTSQGASFKYDALGRRTQKSITSNGGATWAVAYNYYYNGPRVIEERSAGGAVLATYVYGGESVNDMLTMTRSGSVYIYVKNALGSIVALADSSGNVIERYRHDAFGSPTIEEVLPSWCPGSTIQNGSFADSAVAGAMPSPGRTARWTRAYGSPDVKIPGGYGDTVYIGMFGNRALGEAIHHTLATPIVQGHSYSISFAARWAREPNRPIPPQYAFRASNVPLTGPTDLNGTLIGVSSPIDTGGWMGVSLSDWIAPNNYSILTVSVTNRSSSSNGDSVTYAHLDNVCVRDNTAPTARTASIVSNRFMGPAGKEWDGEIRLFNYGGNSEFRCYDPALGRYLQPNSLGMTAGITGEPVPGAEIFVEQEPNDKPRIDFTPVTRKQTPAGSIENQSIRANGYTYVENNPHGKPPWNDLTTFSNSGPYSQSLSNMEDNGIVAVETGPVGTGPGGSGSPNPWIPFGPGWGSVSAWDNSSTVDFVGASVGDPAIIEGGGSGAGGRMMGDFKSAAAAGARAAAQMLPKPPSDESWEGQLWVKRGGVWIRIK